jgi:hypothetical protein
MAISDGKVTAIGRDDETLRLRGPAMRVIDGRRTSVAGTSRGVDLRLASGDSGFDPIWRREGRSNPSALVEAPQAQLIGGGYSPCAEGVCAGQEMKAVRKCAN